MDGAIGRCCEGIDMDIESTGANLPFDECLAGVFVRALARWGIHRSVPEVSQETLNPKPPTLKP